MRNLTIALVTVAVLLGALAVSPAAAQAPRTFVDWLLVDRITVISGNVDVVSGDMTLDSGDMSVTAGDIDATVGDVTAGGNVDVGANLNTTPQSAIDVAQDATITPVGSYQPITASGAVSTDSVASGQDGDILVLVNESSNTITLTDTGTLKLSGDTALGELDSVTLLSDGTNWIELAQADN